jgi:hypothetical protein
MESPSWWGNRRGDGRGVAVRSRPHLINATAAEYVRSLDRLPRRAGRAQLTGTPGGYRLAFDELVAPIVRGFRPDLINWHLHDLWPELRLPRSSLF